MAKSKTRTTQRAQATTQLQLPLIHAPVLKVEWWKQETFWDTMPFQMAVLVIC